MAYNHVVGNDLTSNGLARCAMHKRKIDGQGRAGWMKEACCNFGSVGSSSSETRKSHRVRSFFQVSLSEWGGPTQRPSERERTDPQWSDLNIVI